MLGRLRKRRDNPKAGPGPSRASSYSDETASDRSEGGRGQSRLDRPKVDDHRRQGVQVRAALDLHLAIVLPFALRPMTLGHVPGERSVRIIDDEDHAVPAPPQIDRELIGARVLGAGPDVHDDRRPIEGVEPRPDLRPVSQAGLLEFVVGVATLDAELEGDRLGKVGLTDRGGTDEIDGMAAP